MMPAAAGASAEADVSVLPVSSGEDGCAGSDAFETSPEGVEIFTFALPPQAVNVSIKDNANEMTMVFFII